MELPYPVSRPSHDVTVDADVMVRMRDGVRLATDIYWPTRDGRRIEGPHPVLLHRTPYNKREADRRVGYNHWFASRGYIVVDQDCRGCFRSEGDVDFLLPEAPDGFDTMQWIGEQSWSGKVGTFGTSWSGWTQTALAALGPSNLHAMVPNMSGSNAYTSSVRHNGALELRFIAWAFWHSATNTQAALKSEPWIDAALNLDAPTVRDWLTRWPLRRGQTQLALVPPYERWALELAARADYDDEYWGHPSMNPSRHWSDYPDCPTLYVGGWYDSYTRGTFESFDGHGAAKRGPVRALVGPWTHGTKTVELQHSGDVDFGEAAALPSFRELHLRWFDAWLRGERNGVADEPPVHLFVMGGGSGRMTPEGRLDHGGRWRSEREWPLARTRFTPWFLHGDGTLRERAPTVESSHTSYRFDPSNPVPSIGGNVSSLRGMAELPPGRIDVEAVPPTARVDEIMHAGGFDQREHRKHFGSRAPWLPLGARPDVLVFQTEPLAEDMEVTGPIEVHLWVATSAVDTDFTAKLIDVYPPSAAYPFGYALNISDSILRLRYRNGDGVPALVEPDTPLAITITLYPTSNVFVRGHRIRLDVSSSNFPRFDVNTNTGEPLGRERMRVVANNTVFHDAGRPSRIVLPVIPA